MAKTRNITRGVKIEVATGIRKCHANKSHTISPGDKHLAVYEAQVRENICLGKR